MRRRRSGRWIKWGWCSLVLVVATVTTVSQATAQGGAVRYSFEEARVGGESEYILVPRVEEGLGGEVTAHRMEQAFEALRRARSSTYGRSYAEVSGDDPATASATVHIGADVDDRNVPFIIAEAVYTLTEFGLSEVQFPGHVEGGLTRADIWMPAYTLTVPLWKVTPPGAVTTAQVLMPDGELVSVQEVTTRWERDRQSVIDDIYAFLDSGDELTVRMVIGMLADVGDVRLGEVLPFLNHDDARIRQTALRTLEGYEDDESVLQAVLEAMDEESSRSLKRRMAGFLGASSLDEYKIKEPFFLIEEGEDDEALEAVEALADQSGDERVVEVLKAALRDERSDVAEAASRSLEELRAYDELGQALEDEEVEESLRMAIAESLSQMRSSSERLVGLTYIANERTGGYANQAIAGIADLPVEAARIQTEKFLGDSSRSRRLAAIDALVERNSVASVEALMEMASEQPEGELMEQAAYDIMVSQRLADIIEQTEADSVRVQKVAFQAIGQRVQREGASPQAVATIEGGARHSEASIRGASARSLGELGTDDALATLGEMTDDSSAQVRREVALAIGGFEGDDYADVLMEYLDDDDPRVVAAAIDAMEMRDDRRASDRFREKVEHEEAAIRASAIRAVTSFLPDDEPDTLRRHMALLSGAVSDDAQEVQLSALEQLGRFDDAMAVTHIASQVGSRDPITRTVALKALANTGHDDARPLIETALRDSDAAVRRHAVEALTTLLGSGARPTLEARMDEEEDPEVKEFIETHLQRI